MTVADLVEALPYFRRFSGETIVIKYGGSLMDHPDAMSQFASDVALLRHVGVCPIVVHGGGKSISNWMAKMGKQAMFVDGLRVTDDDTIEIVEMVLCGHVNPAVVAMINHWGGKAVGLSGKDARLMVATQDPNKAHLGWVGHVTEVSPALLHTLTQQGFIPVIASVAINHEGKALNVNADHVAQEIAIAVGAQKLMMLTDVDGLLIEGKVVPHLPLTRARQLLTHPDVSGGMTPKLSSAIRSIESGVGAVHMINGGIPHAVLVELFTQSGIGTMIERDANG